jgi:hypothetical protein
MKLTKEKKLKKKATTTTKVEKIQKSKKGLPHSVASIPLTSQRHLSFKTTQTLSIVASILLLWKGALEVHQLWLRCSWCRIYSNVWLHPVSIHLKCLIFLWTMHLQNSLRKHVSDNTRAKPFILELTKEEP